MLRGGCDSSCGRGRKRRRRGEDGGESESCSRGRKQRVGAGIDISTRETFLPLAGLRRFKVLFFSVLSLRSCLARSRGSAKSQSSSRSRGTNARKTVNSVRFQALFLSTLEFHRRTFYPALSSLFFLPFIFRPFQLGEIWVLNEKEDISRFQGWILKESFFFCQIIRPLQRWIENRRIDFFERGLEILNHTIVRSHLTLTFQPLVS